MCDLLSRIQSLWTGPSTVQYGVAAIELEFIINSFQSLLGVLVTAVTYPPASSNTDNISAVNRTKKQVPLPLTA
jgi:hypothetical protein